MNMDFNGDATYRLRAIAYPLLCIPEQFLLQNVDVIFNVVNAPTSKWRPTEYLAAIRQALASSDDLSKLLLLEEHSNAGLREFLKLAESRLAARLEAT